MSLDPQRLTCPCGPFPPGDPGDEHSAAHTEWLRASEHRALLQLDRALRPNAEHQLRAEVQALKNENFLLLAKLDRQRVDADLARRNLKRVSDWHSPSTHEEEVGLCGGCGERYPCQTQQIIEGREPINWDDLSETYPGSGVFE